MEVFANYDASKKMLCFKPDILSKIMIGNVMLFEMSGLINPWTGPIGREFVAKVENVNGDEDGVSVKLTTKGIKTEGKYANKEVKKSLDRVMSGDYHVKMTALSDVEGARLILISFGPVAVGFDFERLNLLGVEFQVQGDNIKMKPNKKRWLIYNKKEKSIGSLSSSEVMAEIVKKLAEEEEDVKNVKLVVRTKEGNELKVVVEGLEKDGVAWSAKVSGGKKALNYVKSANIDTAALFVFVPADGVWTLN